MEGFELWLGKAKGHCRATFLPHDVVPGCDEAAERHWWRSSNAAISSFKIYLAYKDVFGLTDQELYRALRLGSKARGHNHGALRERGLDFSNSKNQLLAEWQDGPEGHTPAVTIRRG